MQLKGISKQYRTGNFVQKALDGVSVSFRDSEFVAVLGPSGSGKTTLLNIVGGLDRPDSGEIIIGGTSTKKYRSRDWDSYRNHSVGFVFQSYNLIPHRSILSNVELALTIAGISKGERTERARAALERVGLLEHAHKKPSQLSGGQMQRVAIARAIVNDPEILLADEPTGALDSETGLQVMDVMREIARERIVIMVTHNGELAEQYATRIIRLNDGKIVSDSDPYETEEEKQKEHHSGKAGMSFPTALSLSASNLFSKIARTLLVAFAGSIGIIGIALILALSGGVNRYIHDTEEMTLSQYPIELQKTGLSMASMMDSAEEFRRDMTSDDSSGGGQVREVDMFESFLSSVDTNDLYAFRQYLEKRGEEVEEYTQSVEYFYDVTPLIYSLKEDKAYKVNPNEYVASFGVPSSSTLFGSYGSVDVFRALPQNPDLYTGQYDIQAGHWPEAEDECVLVLGMDGTISDFLLYVCGIRDIAEMEGLLRNGGQAEKVTLGNGKKSEIGYEDLIGITFKALSASALYSKEGQSQIWADRSGDSAFVMEAAEKGRTLTVTGVAQPRDGFQVSMLETGIWYDHRLIDRLREDAEASGVVKAQLADMDLNVLTGMAFGEEQEMEVDFSDFVSVDEEALSKAMTELLGGLFDSDGDEGIDISQILPLTERLLAGYIDYAGKNPETDYENLSEAFRIYLSSAEGREAIGKAFARIRESEASSRGNEGLSGFLSDLFSRYMIYAGEKHKTNPLSFLRDFSEYLGSEEGQQAVLESFRSLSGVTSTGRSLEIVFDELVSGYSAYAKDHRFPDPDRLPSSFAEYLSLEGMEILEPFLGMDGESGGARSLDLSSLMEAVQIEVDAAELQSYLTAVMTEGIVTASENLKRFGYAGEEDLSEIMIYPKDFEAKDRLCAIIDDYNDECRLKDEEEKKITYIDTVGMMMSSVTDIVNAITYVLVALVAVSLVVSSVMIGVITYISVLERRKEIGILRAIGASRFNISEVFIAETFITGLSSGALGIAASYLLLIPINRILHHFIGEGVQASAYLAGENAVRLVVLSFTLSILAGLLPAFRAANNDPAESLRTE